jgi:hypothetical protein
VGGKVACGSEVIIASEAGVGLAWPLVGVIEGGVGDVGAPVFVGGRLVGDANGLRCPQAISSWSIASAPKPAETESRNSRREILVMTLFLKLESWINHVRRTVGRIPAFYYTILRSIVT